MLIQFKVKNFMSFRNEAILAMNPSVDKEHPENINNKSNYRAVNSVAIYGANASGKTSLFKAMTVAILMIRNSNFLQVNQPLSGMIPFKFDEKNAKEPTEFEFILVADDDRTYVYGFSADKLRIHEEYLYLYKSTKPTMIFERDGEDYKFKSQKSLLEPLVRFNTPNKLFLATATNWNTECTIIPYKWLSEKMLTFTEISDLWNISFEKYKGEERKAYISFTEDMLQTADINISKINIDVKKRKVNIPFNIAGQANMIEGQVVPNLATQEYEQIEVKTEHIIHKGEVDKICTLGIAEESLGTNQLFVLAPFLKDAFDKGMTIVIDEIEKSLHPSIVKHIVNMFRDKEINQMGAQIVFTTHATSLLSLSTFRRDQIYFTEKDNETGESDLYSLDELSVRKTDNIEKGYLLGRYGAIPYIRGEEF